MIINSLLSSTKDSSIQKIQNNPHKNIKKLFLNQKPPNKNNTKDNGNNINNENSSKKSPKKKIIKLPNDTIYEGYIINNQFEGYGEYHSPSYNYFGNFSLGKKNGKGKLEDFVKKLEYIGDFKDNMKEGFGEEKYQDGSVYIGQFKQNMKNGTGNLFLDGGKNYGYSGTFKNDKISGKGKFKWNDNKQYIGEWDNDEISGYGILQEGNIIRIGSFKHNLKEGYGSTFYTDQNFALLGKWEKDFIEGYAILINLYEKNNLEINDGIIVVVMNKGEISNMSLDEDELNKFKESNGYKKMITLYEEKFYGDYIKYIKNEKNGV